jgi:hypothetical protein
MTFNHIISLASAHSTVPWLRQTPGGLGALGGNLFAPNEAQAGTLVVYDDLAGGGVTCAPRSRRILVIGEPPGMKTYKQDFIAQFGLVLSPYSFETQDVPLRITQTGLPWFYGLRFEAGGITVGQSFEDLLASRPGPKDNKISVVCSTKSKLPRHRERLAFVMALKDRLKDRLVIRGRGFEPVIDKGEAIAPHRYHLVLENNDLGCFWTEKLADAFLGWSLPLYAGTKAALDDFPDGSMIYLDLNDVPSCVAQVERILDEDPYESRLPAIAAARGKLMHEHNFFALISREVERLAPAEPLEQPQVVHANKRASVVKSVRRALKSRAMNVLARLRADRG